MYTAEQIQAHWDRNPDALAQAIGANPGMFGIDLSALGTQALQNYSVNPFPGKPADVSLSDYFASMAGQGLSPERLGSGSTISSSGTIKDTFGPLDQALAQQVTDALNQQRDAYYSSYADIFRSAEQGNVDPSRLPANYDPRATFEEMTGMPTSFSSGGVNYQWDPTTGQFSGFDRGGDSLFASLVKNTPTLMGIMAGGPIAGALGSGISATTQGGSLQDILSASAVGGITGGLFDKLGGGFVQGSAEGAAKEAVKGALGGDFDLGDILKGGLTGGLTSSVADYISDAADAWQHSPERLQMLLDGGPTEAVQSYFGGMPLISEAEAAARAALYRTSDAGKLFGPNGLLGGDYLSTKWLSAGFDALANNPVTDFLIQNPVSRKAFEFLENNGALGGLSRWVMGYDTEAPENAARFEDWYVKGNYDERFPSYGVDRSPDVILHGIHENMPGSIQAIQAAIAAAQQSQTQSPVSGETPLPEQNEGIGETIVDIINEFPKVEDDTLPSPEVPSGQGGPGEGTEALPSQPSAGPGVEDSTPDLPTVEESLTLPSQGRVTNPDGSIFNWDTYQYEYLPPGALENAGGGGGGGGGGAGKGGMLGGGAEWEDFMARLSYVAPIIQALNIPLEDFMKAWMEKK